MDGGGHGGDFGGGCGKGAETPPAAKLTRCDAQAMVSVRPFGFVHVIGLVFLAMGLNIGVGGFLMNLRTDILGAFFVLGFGFLFAGIGYLAIAPCTLEADATMRTYRQCWGWKPLTKVTEGTWEDFEKLSLRTYFRRGKGTALQLHWKDEKRQPMALHVADREEAERYGFAIATLLGLPFVDHTGVAIDPDKAPLDPQLTATLERCESNPYLPLANPRWNASGDRAILGGSVLPVILKIALSGFAGWAGFLLVWISSFGSDTSGIVIGPLQVLYLTGIAILIYAIWGWKERVTLNTTARTYVRERGVFPLIWRQQGPLDAFAHVHLLGVPRQFHGSASFNWCLILAWRENAQTQGNPPTFSVFSMLDAGTKTTASRLAEDLAHKLGLPLKVDAETSSTENRGFP